MYRINSCTKPEGVFNGDLPPSDVAIEQLLETTLSATPTSILRELSVKLQEAIVSALSAERTTRARIRYIRDIDSLFT